MQYGEVGDTVRLLCDAFAIPPPDTVTWLLNGQELPPPEEDDNSRRFKKEEDRREDGITSTLVIRNITKEDMVADYNCTVFNQFGHDSVLIELREQSFPVLAILGIVVGTVLVALLVAQAAMVAHKKIKRRKRLKSYRRSLAESSLSKSTSSSLSSSSSSSSSFTDSDGGDSDSSLSSVSHWTVRPSEDSYVPPMFHSSSVATLVHDDK